MALFLYVYGSVYRFVFWSHSNDGFGHTKSPLPMAHEIAFAVPALVIVQGAKHFTRPRDPKQPCHYQSP